MEGPVVVLNCALTAPWCGNCALGSGGQGGVVGCDCALLHEGAIGRYCVGMTMTDIHCPNCGHRVFSADIGELIESPTPPPRLAIGSGTEVAVALLNDFFAEQQRVVRVAHGRVPQSAFIDAFNDWAIGRGSNPQSAAALGRGLRELGIEHARSSGQRFYRGLAFTHAP